MNGLAVTDEQVAAINALLPANTQVAPILAADGGLYLLDDLLGDPKTYGAAMGVLQRLTRAPFQTPEQKRDADAALIAAITTKTQQRLDDFAQTRGYDNILSACSYAGSSISSFAAEGVCCMRLRDETWAGLAHGLAEVAAGDRPMPSSYEEIEAELPQLSWDAA